MEINIRKVLPTEAYEYAACHIACWQAAYRGIMTDEYLDNMSAEKMAEDTRQALSNPGVYRFYCVELDRKMIGRLVVSKSRDEDKPDAGEIAAMYLAGEYWDKGYGRKMMDFSIKEIKKMGYDEAFLWVLEENSRARKFYEKCGFEFDGAKKETNIDKPLAHMRYVRAF